MTAVELPFTPHAAEEWNPYFVAYASSLGLAPGDVIAAGRWAADFMAWIRQRWDEWAIAAEAFRPFTFEERQDFGAWLAANYPEVTR